MRMMEALAKQNFTLLKNNIYPGRGIVIGKTPDSTHMVQIYWIMGRSENSRNRIFINENGSIRTEAHDPAKLKDPSLIIYYAARHFDAAHIVTNGDQTDTIYAAFARGVNLERGHVFQDALDTRTFEPDAPNYTPRISGLIDLKDTKAAYRLSILKSIEHDPRYSVRQHYSYEQGISGIGHCLHTYAGDGGPLPSFAGDPYVLPLDDHIEDVARRYWDVLNTENRISLLVKFIDPANGAAEIRIVNKHQ